MFSRVVSLLVPCALLIQSAAIGHVHCGNQTAGQDFRPHVHTNQVNHRHDHQHGHGSSSHHHHDSCNDKSEFTTDVVPQSEPSPGHDEDAVYFSNDQLVSGRMVSAASVGGSHWQMPAMTVAVTHRDVAGLGSTLILHPALRAARSDCPLYLRHLSLLI